VHFHDSDPTGDPLSREPGLMQQIPARALPARKKTGVKTTTGERAGERIALHGAMRGNTRTKIG